MISRTKKCAALCKERSWPRLIHRIESSETDYWLEVEQEASFGLRYALIQGNIEAKLKNT